MSHHIWINNFFPVATKTQKYTKNGAFAAATGIHVNINLGTALQIQRLTGITICFNEKKEREEIK